MDNTVDEKLQNAPLCEAEPQTTEGTQAATQKRVSRPQKPFPSYTIEEALKIPQAIAKSNAGNPWGSEQIADAISMGARSSSYYYYATASRDYGMTTGTGRGKTIELTSLGRKIVFPENPEQEAISLAQAFNNIDIFKKVFEYYRGGELPERRFVCNTLQETFNLDASYHDEFIETYSKNVTFLNRKGSLGSSNGTCEYKKTGAIGYTDEFQEQHDTNKELFVIMPFSEKTGQYPEGYFDEVFSSLIVPAAANAGYVAQTANISGSDIIHKTIVNRIYNAELILADLTEHNPNVLFELGLAIAFKKKVAIIRAKGTKAIFDVDNSMRVLDYSPNLWKSTLEMDVAKLTQHIESTAINSDSSYLDIFLG
ncbi:MAG: hypothetical protein ACI4P4_09875 [Faecousia sp.]